MASATTAKTMGPQSGEGAATVEKAIDVLFHLHEAGVPLGVTAIGRALGSPKSSVHRLLRSLGRRGLTRVRQPKEARL